MSYYRRERLKKIIFPLVFGAALLVTGCNEKKDVENNSSNVTVQSEELTIVKTYDTELGNLEAYYLNDEIEETHEENGIGLTITSVEYGKVLVNESNRSTYEELADADGKNTYIKVGVELNAEKDAYEKDEITFYIDHATVDVQGKEVAADTTYSDKVSISGGKVKDMDKGYLYFLVDASMPFTSLLLNVPAPFKDGLSISENYQYKIELQ